MIFRRFSAVSESGEFSWRHVRENWRFSLGVGLLVIQVGAYLLPGLSAPQALLAVVLGSLLGSGLLAWVAAIGCRHGLSSSALIGRSLGQHFAVLPVGLNVLQLLGWTAFELVVMRDGTSAIAGELFGFKAAWLPTVATLVWGTLLLVGASDMVSIIIRNMLVQIATPDQMRGRVTAIELIFIGASNELGEFESGITAALLGAVPATVVGGLGTIVVALLWMKLFPSLQKFDRLE